MDIQRPRIPERNPSASRDAGILALLLAILGVARLAAAPGVDRSTLWIDTVKRGPMPGRFEAAALVPEDIRWISATTQGKVEHPSATRQNGSGRRGDSRAHESPASAGAAGCRVQIGRGRSRLQKPAGAIEQRVSPDAGVGGGYRGRVRKALLQADVNEQMAKQHLVSDFALRQSRLDADQLAIRNDIAKKQLAGNQESMPARIAVQQSDVDQAKAIVALKRRQAADLHVRAGFPGVLQVVPVEVGQQVTPGTNLARVANPSLLKAAVKIAETQAKDIQVGQKASVDTRDGIVAGRVVRVDPSVQNGTVTVDIELEGALPKGARPDLSVDGTIELERLSDVLYVGVPAIAQEQTSTNLFRVGSDGTATRVQVKLGRASVSAIEILDGLKVGDQVILSDTSAVGGYDRIRLQKGQTSFFDLRKTKNRSDPVFPFGGSK